MYACMYKHIHTYKWHACRALVQTSAFGFTVKADQTLVNDDDDEMKMMTMMMMMMMMMRIMMMQIFDSYFKWRCAMEIFNGDMQWTFSMEMFNGESQ